MAESRTIATDVSGSLTHEGNLIIMGNVMPCAVINVKNGSLRIDGNVGENAHITQKDAITTAFNGGGAFFSGGNVIVDAFSGGNICIIDNKTYINGRATKDDDGLSGIRIKGSVASRALLSSNASISAGDTGDNVVISASGSIDLGTIGQNALITSGGRLNASDIGDGSAVTAKGRVSAGNIGANCKIVTSAGLCALAMGAGTSISANGTITLAKTDAAMTENARPRLPHAGPR